MEEIKTVKYEAPTVREDEHATQEEAINNIQAGNVATADNLTYELSLIYRKVAADYATDSPPQFAMTIPMGTPGTESFMEFKSGYKLGITYVGGDITAGTLVSMLWNKEEFNLFITYFLKKEKNRKKISIL